MNLSKAQLPPKYKVVANISYMEGLMKIILYTLLEKLRQGQCGVTTEIFAEGYLALKQNLY